MSELPRAEKHPVGAASIGVSETPTLHAESILLKAFDTANETARQAYQARESTINLYLLLVGALGTALGAIVQFGAAFRSLSLPSAAIALLAGSILSVTLFARYISHRASIDENLIRASLIVEYYLRYLQPSLPHLGDVLRQRLTNVPRLRFGLLRFIIQYPMAIGGSLCFAASTYIAATSFIPLLPNESPYGLPLTLVATGVVVPAFALTFAIQVFYFVRVVRHQQRTIDYLTAKLKNWSAISQEIQSF